LTPLALATQVSSGVEQAHGRTIRVVRVITRLNVGGPSIQALMLTDRLSREGFPTTLIHGRLGPGEGDMRYLVDGRVLDVRFVPTLQRELSPLADLRTLWTLVATLRRLRPSIVHTHMAKAGTLARVAALICNAWPLRARIQTVHTYHGHVLEGYFSGWKTRLFVAVERWLAATTDRIIAISPRIRRELIDQYRIGRDAQYAVVPLGFELSPFAQISADDRVRARVELGISPGAAVITTVGRLTAIKQHELFLEMARRISEARADAVFLIAGDGEERERLEASTDGLGLRDRVRFLGWRRDLATLYAATDVFALTSRNEGTPVALIEAMAAGVPGVATDVGGVGDVIADPSLGTLVPFGDPDALARAVEALVADSGARERMGARARASVLARYDMARLVEEMAALYRELAPA
jgi:glycosyltransferase involved in cell wall biosynthesis